MPKTGAERSREYRQRKRVNKLKTEQMKIAKSSTERSREFRARQRASSNVQHNISIVSTVQNSENNYHNSNGDVLNVQAVASLGNNIENNDRDSPADVQLEIPYSQSHRNKIGHEGFCYRNMERIDQYKGKTDAMQKYVPLLIELIEKLEGEKYDRSAKKVHQLKVLLLQLTNPKPGLTDRELINLEGLLKNLLNIQTDEENVNEANFEENIKTDNDELDGTKYIGMISGITNEQILINTNESEFGNTERILPTELIAKTNTDTTEIVKEAASQGNQGQDKVEFVVIYENVDGIAEGEDELILPDENIISESKVSLISQIPNYENNTLIQSEDNQITQLKIIKEENVQSIKNNGIKRLNNTNEIDSNDLLAKKPKISQQSDSKINNNDESQRCAEKSDPLFVDNDNESTIPEAEEVEEDFREIFNENNNCDDDVEIIENRSSPILIESDDDTDNKDSSKKHSVNELKKRSGKCFIGPKSIKERMEREKNKTEAKRILKIQELNSDIQTLKKKTIPIAKTSISLPPATGTQQTNFLSKVDLLPKSVPASSNTPRHFKACIGNKATLIPNAFYTGNRNQQTTNNNKSNTTKSNNATTTNSSIQDEAHCRWLDNFLKNFCCSFSTIHNTCYLLLQRALRQDDFARIRQQRIEMQRNDTESSDRLLTQLKSIFYMDGKNTNQKLTFIGRKFCELAFVNILDKTISLTLDTRTNKVTSRTRISAATLKSIRDGKASADVINVSNTEIPIINFTKEASSAKSSNDIVKQNITISTPATAKAITTATPKTTVIARKTLSVTRKKDDDQEYSPWSEGVHISTDKATPLRRSLRTPKRIQCSNDSTDYFSYNEDAEDDTTENNISEQQNQKPGMTPASMEYIAKKRLDNEKECQNKAQSFETAFIQTITQNSDSPIAKAASSKFNQKSQADKNPKIPTKVSTLQTQKEKDEIDSFVISDDDDDVECIDPPTNQIQSDSISKIHPNKSGVLPKNTDEKVHAMSRFNDFCLLCNRSIARVVGHYVNAHPNNEVFTSRPTPKAAKSLLNNELSLAALDRSHRGFNLVVATCIFCNKKGSFTLSYWYHHFATHTGEYAYKCDGCGLRKPTRSQIITHVQQNCSKMGAMEVTQKYDLNLTKICGYICRLCNYTQMNFANILKHLKSQHHLLRTEKRFWDTVILLETPKPTMEQTNNKQTTTTTVTTTTTATATTMPKTVVPIRAPTMEAKRFYVHNSNGDVYEIEGIGEEQEFISNDETPVVVNEAEFESNEDSDWYSNQSTLNSDEPFTEFEIEHNIKQE